MTARRAYSDSYDEFVDAPLGPEGPAAEPRDAAASGNAGAGNGTKAAPRFQLVRFADVRIAPGRNYLVKGLLPRSGIAVIYGPPKCGKSFFTTDLFARIALGWKYRGRRVQQGSCVYVACEGHAGFPARIEAFRRSFLAETNRGDGEVEIREVPFYYVAANLDLIADHKALAQAIQLELGGNTVAALVFDTLNRSLNGSESKDEDMGKYLRAAGSLIERFGCLVALVHHTGVNETRPRGHTSLTGAADAQIRVERDNTADNIVASVEWLKDGPEGDQIVSRLKLVDVDIDPDGDPVKSCVVIPVEGPAIAPTQKKQPPLPKAARTALRALREAVQEVGQPAPASNHIPPNIAVVTVDQWRTYAYRLGISVGEERAKQRAFKRAHEHLVGTEAVAVWDDYVWPTR
jgi:hypothetical protein